jgi:uncharacterized secreted protein with C-terminal beta-propeller domain
MTTRRAVAVAAAVLIILGAVSAAVALNGGGGGGDRSGDEAAGKPRRTTSTTEATTPTTEGQVTATAAGDAIVLQRFDDCRSVLDEARRQAIEKVTPYGLPFPGYMYGSGGDVVMEGRVAAAPSSTAGDSAASTGATSSGGTGGPEFSGTNLQEQGVDEPDIVKNDGRVAFSLVGRRLYSVLIGDGGALRNGDAIDLDVQPGAELLRSGDDVIVMSRTAEFSTRIFVVDASDPASLELVRQVEVEGRYISARQIGETIRLVVTQNGPAFDFIYPQSETPAEQANALTHNRNAIRQAKLAEWLPDVTIDRNTRLIPAPACDDVYLTKSFAGPGSTSVITFSPSEGKVLDAASVMATATEVYATTKHLYVATSVWGDPRTGDGVSGETTEIHRFDVSDPTHSVYEATGTVAGHLLRPPWFVPGGPIAQWAMSEDGDDLRVATTIDGPQGLDNAVTVLRPAGKLLAPVGTVAGIGRGEQLYAVRFMGDRGYVVTYRRVDPLFVLDLSDPRAPRVTGEFKMPGYSAYLHPIGDDLLLGVGQGDQNEDGFADGTEVSVFDVADPAHPRRIGQTQIGPRGTIAGVESDPRTFTWWPRPARAILTVWNWNGQDGFHGAVGLEPGRSGVREIGRITETNSDNVCGMPALRTRVVGDIVLLFAPDGVRTAALSDLSPRGSLTFEPTDEQWCSPMVGPPTPGRPMPMEG